MKVNLECGDDIRSGYVNISGSPRVPDNLPDHATVIPGHFSNLDPILKDGTVEELIFNPPINILLPSDIVPVLEHWRNKLKPDGLLKLSCLDIRKIARNIYLSDLPLQEVDILVFGPQHMFKSVLDSHTLTELIKSMGFEIQLFSPKNVYVTLEASKKDGGSQD